MSVKDRKFDIIISEILRIGVILSIVLITLGLLLMFSKGGGLNLPLQAITSSNSKFNSSLINIYSLTGVASFDGVSYIILGLLVLISIPIVRTFISLVHYIIEKDVVYIILTIIVLINILFAIFFLPFII